MSRMCCHGVAKAFFNSLTRLLVVVPLLSLLYSRTCAPVSTSSSAAAASDSSLFFCLPYVFASTFVTPHSYLISSPLEISSVHATVQIRVGNIDVGAALSQLQQTVQQLSGQASTVAQMQASLALLQQKCDQQNQTAQHQSEAILELQATVLSQASLLHSYSDGFRRAAHRRQFARAHC
jgi:hypothetical protein